MNINDLYANETETFQSLWADFTTVLGNCQDKLLPKKGVWCLIINYFIDRLAETSDIAEFKKTFIHLYTFIANYPQYMAVDIEFTNILKEKLEVTILEENCISDDPECLEQCRFILNKYFKSRKG